jgi:SWI/SNF-related matrix-associated actin-dependent regulator of chromatin subfamily A-like protein 1
MSTSRTDLAALLGSLYVTAAPHLQGDPVVVSTGMATKSCAHNAELPASPLNDRLLGFQRAGVAFALEARRCIIGHDMGLGKTVQAIATLAATPAPTPALVVCQPNLVLNWVREFAKWAPAMRIAVITGQTPGELPDADVLIIGDSVLWHWHETLIAADPSAMVIDESQRMKSRGAKRTKAALEISRKMKSDALIVLLTGTAIKGTNSELLSQLTILGVEEHFGGISGFMDRYMPKVDRFARESANTVELFERLSDSIYARLEFEEVKYQFEAMGISTPGTPLRQAIPVEMTGTYAKQYTAARDDLREFLVATRGERRADSAMRAEALTRLGVLRHLIGLAKVDGTVAHVKNMVEDGEQVIVFAWHRDVVDAIVEALSVKHTVGKIYGGIKVEAVEETKAAFQAGDLDVIVLNIEAGATGHTLTASARVVFNEFAWSPSDMAQCEARANRLGQDRTVLSHWMTGANGVETIDERLVEIINDKAVITNATLNGRIDETMIQTESVANALLDWAEFG